MTALAIAQLPPARTVAPPVEGLGLAPASLHPGIQRAVAGLHLHIELLAAVDLVVARLESACPDLLLIDTDLLGCPADLCRFARSLRTEIKVVGLACYWSEREEGLLTCADAILHKPARDTEWTAILRRFGVPDANVFDGGSPTSSS